MNAEEPTPPSPRREGTAQPLQESMKKGIADSVDALQGIDLDALCLQVWKNVHTRIAADEAMEVLQNEVEEVEANSFVRTVKQFLNECADQAKEFAYEQLGFLLTRLAEHAWVRAHCASIYLFDAASSKLTMVAGRNLSEQFHVIDLGGIGIVAHVARSQKAYFTNDVENDKYYRACFSRTRSEIVVPLISTGGELLGVLNLESVKQNIYSDDTIKWLERRLAKFRIHLEVLRSLLLHPSECPWHPMLHGWNFRRIMDRLCKTITKSLGDGTSTCTAWYCDHRKNQAFAFATCGYDFEHLARETLPLDRSKIGRVLQSMDLAPVTFIPTEDPQFMRRQKAEYMDIREAHMLRVPSLHREQQSEFVLAIYTRSFGPGEEEKDIARRKVIREGLPNVVKQLQVMGSSFLCQRQSYMLGHAREEVSASGADAFSRLLPWIVRSMGVQDQYLEAFRPLKYFNAWLRLDS